MVIGINLYSLALRTLYGLLYPILNLLPKIRFQLQGRWPSVSDQSRTKSKEGSDHRISVVFFCSSAGEFEQAIPILERLKEKGLESLICFFSASGPRFLKARGYDYAHVLAPLDTIGNWEKFFRRYQPRVSIIIRHELWPAFCYVSGKFSRLLVLHMTKPVRAGIFKNVLKRLLLSQASLVSAVDRDSYQYLLNVMGSFASEKALLIADTKFDRLLDRQKQLINKAEHESIKKCLAFCGEHVFIVGSAWHADAAAALHGFKEYLSSTKDLSLTLCLVPHEPTTSYVNDFISLTQNYGLSVCTLQQVLHEDAAKPMQVLIVDRLGLLTDLYRHARLVMVGGAMHHKVHNVIEPAAYGIPLCFGPNYKNAPEAIELINLGLAQVVKTGGDVKRFIKDTLQAEGSLTKQKLLEHVQSKAGASDRIVEIILKQVESIP